MTHVVDEIEQLIRRHLLSALGPDPSGELAAASLADLVIDYLNWRSRFIAARPRRVQLAPELLASMRYGEHRPAVDDLERKIRAGAELTPYLSRRVATAYVPRASRQAQAQRRRDLDLLVADWSIHHLHLSTTAELDGFVTRTDDLLFAHFAERDAYLIGIFPHGSWAALEIAQICVRNWPRAEIFHEARGIIGLAQPNVDDEARLQLRNVGITTFLEIEGKVYMPLGQTTAGTPMHATQSSNRLMHALETLREDLAAQPEAMVRTAGGDLAGQPPAWEAVQTGDTFRVRERTTGATVWRCNFYE